MTRKLYYEKLYQREFDAEVLSQDERGGKYNVVLDQTLFYPSGGGQPCDLGNINGVEVLEVLEDGEEVIHVLKNKLDSKNIHGVIDWDRRFELMQQHLGQHLFSASLYNICQLHTARMRIEGHNVSLDLDVHVDEKIILEAERAANEAVWQDIPVEILYPDMDDVKAFARKQPPANSVPPIRIVKVQGIDYVPCCGLHVSSTGQVGMIKITSYENHKGGTRIYLKCGRAAYIWLDDVYHEIRKAESELVCGYDGINEKIINLKTQIHELKAHNEETVERFLKPAAEKLINNAEIFNGYKIIRHVMKNSDQEEIKHLFRLLTDNNHDVIALLAGENDSGICLIFGTNRENKNVDVRPAFKKAINIVDGKGGGSSFCAQGFGKNSGNAGSVIEAAFSELKNNFTSNVL